MVACREKSKKSDVSCLQTYFFHLFKKCEGMHTMPMQSIPSNHRSPGNHILLSHFIKNIPCNIYTSAFSIHIYKRVSHKKI
eukprot:Gb_39932 [translate_table: standard]